MRRFHAMILACCTLALPVPFACAASNAPPGWHPVDAEKLDAARGGFQLPSGLAVGLGIERTVAINGELVTRTRFDIADVRLLTVEQASQARAAMSSLQLIQNGRVAGPETAPGMALGPVLGATLIQNSLDQQHIETRTIIDASVNTLGSLKALNFSSTMLDALTRAVPGH